MLAKSHSGEIGCESSVRNQIIIVNQVPFDSIVGEEFEDGHIEGILQIDHQLSSSFLANPVGCLQGGAGKGGVQRPVFISFLCDVDQPLDADNGLLFKSFLNSPLLTASAGMLLCVGIATASENSRFWPEELKRNNV